MHIHLPKPLHGWKEFANEIFVIVIGVLIALAFEAGVEELHWRHKSEDGRERLRTEIQANFNIAAEMATVTPCVLAQLDKLQAYLGSRDAAQKPMPIDQFPDNHAVLRLPTRSWGSTTWDAMQQDGTSSHLPVAEQRQLGLLYSQIESMSAQTAESGKAAGQLLATGYPGELTEQTRSDLRLVVADEYQRIQLMGRVSGQILATASALDFAPHDSAKVLDQILRNKASNTIGYCKQQGLPLNDWKAEMNKWAPSARKPG